MPFNLEEFETETEEVQEPTRQDAMVGFLSDLNPEQNDVESDEEGEDYLSEVERRLEVAAHYNELLKRPLFSERTEASRIVEREHRRFVKERMEILLGIKVDNHPKQMPAQFTPTEAEGLKALINQMRQRGMLEEEPVVVQVRKPAPTPPVPVRAAPVAPPVSRAMPVQQEAKKVVKAEKKQAEVPKTRKPRVRIQTVDHPVTGEPYDFAVPEVQKPAGMVPFPDDVMTSTYIAASSQVDQATESRGVFNIGQIAEAHLRG